MNTILTRGMTVQEVSMAEDEAAVVDPDWPAWRYHLTEPGRVVQNAEEAAALGSGWRDTPYTDEEKADQAAQGASEETPARRSHR